MMRLQRVGRRNDPSYRIVVTNKRTGPKSDKHVDRLGSYNPKLKNFQLDVEKAKEWLAKGVQPSDTMYNLLVSNKVIEGRKKNVLPKKSPVVKEEAEATEETPAEEGAEATEETPAKESAEETPAEEPAEEKKEETPAEEAEEEKAEEVSAEEKKEEEAPETTEEKKD